MKLKRGPVFRWRSRLSMAGTLGCLIALSSVWDVRQLRATKRGHAVTFAGCWGRECRLLRGHLQATGKTGLSAVTEAAASDMAGTSEQKNDHSDSPQQSSGLSKRLRDRLADRIATQEAQVEPLPREDQKRIVTKAQDLNGIDPWTCVLGSVPVAGLSYGFWTLTGAAAEWFVTHPIESDFYPVQRLGIAFQTAVVGLSSLAAGIFGFTALGIFLLGLRVFVGIAKGELDPNKVTTTPQRQTTAEKVRDIMTKDPVEVVMAKRRQAQSQEATAGDAMQ